MVDEYIACICENEVLAITDLTETTTDLVTVEIALSMYVSRGSSYPWSLRLRHIWQILTKGYPYQDEIILDGQGLARIADRLSSLARKHEVS